MKTSCDRAKDIDLAIKKFEHQEGSKSQKCSHISCFPTQPIPFLDLRNGGDSPKITGGVIIITIDTNNRYLILEVEVKKTGWSELEAGQKGEIPQLNCPRLTCKAFKTQKIDGEFISCVFLSHDASK